MLFGGGGEWGHLCRNTRRGKESRKGEKKKVEHVVEHVKDNKELSRNKYKAE